MFCALVLQTMPCSQHKTHSVNQNSISLYVLYSARNVFKTIIGYDCYPLLVLRLPNDFQSGSLGPTAPVLDVNMGGWGWG